MKRVLGFAPTVAFGACLAQAALAAPLPPADAPVAPAEPSWTNVYLGGDVGGLFDNARYFRPTTPTFADTGIGTIDSRPTFGAYTGANYQILPWMVVGIEYAYTRFSDASYRELGIALDFLQMSRHVESVTGRLGILLTPDTMLYGKAGAARLQVQGVDGFGNEFDQRLPGVQTGIGLETRLAPYFSLRGEVSYTYADRLLSLNNGADVYRPSFLMFQLGASVNLEPPSSWRLGATPTAVAWNALPAINASPSHGAEWTGIEFGGFISGTANRSRYQDTVGGELGPYTDFDIGGGWFAGADYQFQRIVVGIEGSGNYEGANFNNAAGVAGAAGTVYRFASIDRQLALTGRVGWLATPDTLLYFRAGPADIRFTPNPAYWNAIAPNVIGGRNFPGYLAGIGVESFLTQNLSVRVEGSITHTNQVVVLQGVVPNEFTLQPAVASMLVGLALHI